MKKNNNKGFSLVELIVVVLIMGIIAVALAPQVMKWVDKARTNSDANTKKDLKASFNTAIADALGDGKTVTAGTVVISSANFSQNGTTSFGELEGYVYEVLGGDFPTKANGGNFSATLTEVSTGSWKVEIN